MEQISYQEIDFSAIHTDQVRHCLKRMLDKNPESRATIEELICMDWVTNSGEDPINDQLIEQKNMVMDVQQSSPIKTSQNLLADELSMINSIKSISSQHEAEAK